MWELLEDSNREACRHPETELLVIDIKNKKFLFLQNLDESLLICQNIIALYTNYDYFRLAHSDGKLGNISLCFKVNYKCANQRFEYRFSFGYINSTKLEYLILECRFQRCFTFWTVSLIESIVHWTKTLPMWGILCWFCLYLTSVSSFPKDWCKCQGKLIVSL